MPLPLITLLQYKHRRDRSISLISDRQQASISKSPVDKNHANLTLSALPRADNSYDNHSIH